MVLGGGSEEGAQQKPLQLGCGALVKATLARGIPSVVRQTARRVASNTEEAPERLVGLLEATHLEALQPPH